MIEAAQKVIDENLAEWVRRSNTETLKPYQPGCFIWDIRQPSSSGMYYTREMLPDYYGPMMVWVLDKMFDKADLEKEIIAVVILSHCPDGFRICKETGEVLEEHWLD